MTFKHGELFESSYETSVGRIGFLAEVLIEGTSLHLKDVVIEPLTTGLLSPGTIELLKAKEQLIQSARDAGFERLRISGERLTGAKIGKKVDIVIDLSE